VNINKDVLAINDAFERLKKSSESVGYIDSSIGGLHDKLDAASNFDDKEAYSAEIERMSTMLDLAKDDQAQARQEIKDAFEHYYS